MTLVEWLRSVLDLVEAHAQKDLWALDRATPGRWEAHYGHNLPYSLIRGEGGVEIARFEAVTGPLPDGADDLHAADILLVVRLVRRARQRAEQTLRTVAAHREILDRHQPDSTTAEDPYCFACTCPARDCPAEAPDWPCKNIRSLAAIYAESHPGFDESWIEERS